MTEMLRRFVKCLVIAVAIVAVGLAVLWVGLRYRLVDRMLGWDVARPAASRPLPAKPHVLGHCAANWREVAKPYEEKTEALRIRMEKAARRAETVPDSGGLTRLETEKGSFWVPTKEVNVLFYELAGMENGEYGTGKESVRSNDVVLDCGAHFGAFTRYALDKGARLVVAIDINPVVLECMRRTFAKEIAAGWVIVFGKGVWNKEDEMALETPGETAGSTVVLGGPRPGVKVPLTKIDTLFADLRLPRVDFIKMDIEGAEKPAIEGAAEVIRKFKPRMAITTYHKDEDPYTLPLAVRAIDPEYWFSMPRCWARWYRPNSVPIPEVTFFWRAPS